MKKSNNPTRFHHLLLIDESGSMQTLKEMVIQNVNDMLRSIYQTAQKYKGQDHRLTLLSFSGSGIKQWYYNYRIENQPTVESRNFKPDSTTKVYDCLGLGIGLIKSALGKSNSADKVFVTLLTDGMDTGSLKYSKQGIMTFIYQLKREGWIFNIVGMKPGMINWARSLGIDNHFFFQARNERCKSQMFKNRLIRCQLARRKKYSKNVPLTSAA